MLFIVSVTVDVVVVFEVIEPWVKFGTTGTALTGDAIPNAISASKTRFMTTEVLFQSRIGQ